MFPVEEIDVRRVRESATTLSVFQADRPGGGVGRDNSVTMNMDRGDARICDNKQWGFMCDQRPTEGIALEGNQMEQNVEVCESSSSNIYSIHNLSIGQVQQSLVIASEKHVAVHFILNLT